MLLAKLMVRVGALYHPSHTFNVRIGDIAVASLQFGNITVDNQAFRAFHTMLHFDL
jgi:hypothetical protein